MPKKTVKILMGTARSKSELLAKSPLQYMVLSMLADSLLLAFAAVKSGLVTKTPIREFLGRSA